MDDREALVEFLFKENGDFDPTPLEIRGLLRFGLLAKKIGKVTRAEFKATGVTNSQIDHLLNFGILEEEYGKLVLAEPAKEVADIADILAKGLQSGLKRAGRKDKAGREPQESPGPPGRRGRKPKAKNGEQASPPRIPSSFTLL